MLSRSLKPCLRQWQSRRRAVRNVDARARQARAPTDRRPPTGRRAWRRLLVVVLARNDDELFVGRSVHEAMFVSDAARPLAFELVLEGFGFADAVEGRLRGFDKQAANALEQFLVRLRPFVVGVESRLVKRDEPH